MLKTIHIGDIKIGDNRQIVLIAGPCVIESRDHCFYMANSIKELTLKLEIPFIFKASYDKANRSSIQSYRGPGIEKGLEILNDIKEKLNIRVLSDVHSVEEARVAGEVLDIIQIPAFLCRQTDIVLSAAKSGKAVNVKKGQFLAPWDIINVLKKIESTGNQQILLTERGTCFGYNYLVSDMRSLVIMRRMGYPVIFDATHSVQMPGGEGYYSGGDSKYVDCLSRAATAVGVDALFIEVHDNPENALSDSTNMLSIDSLALILRKVKAIDSLIKGESLDGY